MVTGNTANSFFYAPSIGTPQMLAWEIRKPVVSPKHASEFNNYTGREKNQTKLPEPLGKIIANVSHVRSKDHLNTIWSAIELMKTLLVYNHGSGRSKNN